MQLSEPKFCFGRRWREIWFATIESFFYLDVDISGNLTQSQFLRKKQSIMSIFGTDELALKQNFETLLDRGPQIVTNLYSSLQC